MRGTRCVVITVIACVYYKCNTRYGKVVWHPTNLPNMSDIERVRSTFRRFAEDECKGYSEHYYHLSAEIANDDWLVGFIAEMPVIQPNLFLASLQFLTGPAEMPRSGQQTRSLVMFEAQAGYVADAIASHPDERARPMRTILPALPKGPLALLEVGASAGLMSAARRIFIRIWWPTFGTGCPHLFEYGASLPARRRCPTLFPRLYGGVVWTLIL